MTTSFPLPSRAMSWPEQLREAELAAKAALVLEDVERRLLSSPDEVARHMNVVAWRLTREIARVRGLLVSNREPLSALVATRWTQTDRQRDLPEPPEANNPADHALRLAWDLPLAYSQPHHQQWTYLMEFTAAYLAVPHTGPFRAALNFLLDDPARFWPSPSDLTDYDTEFVEATSRRLLKQSRQKVTASLQRTFGLLAHEARNLVGVATSQYEYLAQGSKAAQKGLLVARLDDFAHRMREGLNPREEFQALKEIGLILGLKQPEPEAQEEDMTDVIRRVTAEEDEEKAQAAYEARALDVRPAG